ncbi:PQQ-dependent sugar dehydrogenase [Planktomarina temperata]|nr:PQQ-dependent sugar dehydrogenase [Planktomarina temperata]MDC1274108.1 PQQ-dependent sugar dehydrogenase [Planktomarina temperata]
MRTVILILLINFASNAWANGVITGSANGRLEGKVISQFNSPWAMSFINSYNLLVTTKSGKLWLINTGDEKSLVSGIPNVFAGGQGGLGDVVLHPNYAKNKLVYVSYINSDDEGRTRYASVIRGTLENLEKPQLKNIETIWKQTPAQSGKGHFSHRIAFGLDGTQHAGKIFITSGDRQEQTPAQQWDMALGKIIRLNEDGTVPIDNPFQDKGYLAKTFWTVGHRNALGIAFAKDGQLWAHEMGPMHGDELNLIVAGENYGWPIVSEGNHYSGARIPVHETRPDITAPKLYWVPTVAPSGLIFYDGDEFPEWKGNAFIGGLKSKALVRIGFNDGEPFEAERFSWSKRVREVEMGNDGAIWVLEDGPSGRLIRFTKPNE